MRVRDDDKNYAAKAAEMWAAMPENDKGLIRFGMFPAGKMAAAEKAGFTDSRILCCCLMDCAAKDGGMRA
jgi:hypothetical protein